MRILAIDTAAAACSVALWQDGTVAAEAFAAMTRGHAEALVPMIGDAMDRAGMSYGDLDALAVTVGPGAFTGLRIGLATARGIALGAKLPVLGVTSLDAIAAAVPETEWRHRDLLAVLDSKRGDLYAQGFRDGVEPQTAPKAIAPAALAEMVNGLSPVVVVGDGTETAISALHSAGIEAIPSTAPGTPRAAVVAALAAARGPTGCLTPDPLYLRPPEAKVAADGGRLRP